jgi:hypothetical protein
MGDKDLVSPHLRPERKESHCFHNVVIQMCIDGRPNPGEPHCPDGGAPNLSFDYPFVFPFFWGGCNSLLDGFTEKASRYGHIETLAGRVPGRHSDAATEL